jgi:hypothetical protein
MGWRGSQEFGTPVHGERYSLSDMDVYTSRFKDATRGWAPQVIQDSRRGFNGIRGGFGGLWSKPADWERCEV